MKTGREIVEMYSHLFYQDGGFSCGPGWNDLIELMLHRIDSHIKHSSKIHEKHPDGIYTYTIDENKFADFKITNIKEKFGYLSVYCTGADDYIQATITFAETMSQFFCEECGSNQNLGKTTGWIRVICNPCFLKKAYEDPSYNMRNKWRTFAEIKEINLTAKNFFEQ